MRPVNAKKMALPASSTVSGIALPTLRTADAAPLHELVKRHLSEAILLGQWTPGAVLPSEVSLAQSFGVAVGTVRRALSDLTAEGLLSRRRKTGTVVTGRTPHHSLRFFFQYFRLHGMDGAMLRSRPKVLSVMKGAAAPDEAAQLAIEPGADVLRLHRLRLIGDTPIMRDRFVFPAARLPDFPTKVKDVPELLYLYLLERYGLRISAVRERLTSELASREDLALLELKAPAPVLVIDEIAYDQSGSPITHGRHSAATKTHCYINEIR